MHLPEVSNTSMRGMKTSMRGSYAMDWMMLLPEALKTSMRGNNQLSAGNVIDQLL